MSGSGKNKNRLKRKLSFWDGASLIVANVIGIGIFTTPGIVAGMVPDSGSFMLVWLLGGIFAVVGAIAYSELSARNPEAGGEYVYLREAFGPLWGFLSGWTSFIAGFPGAIAAASIGFAAYVKNILPGDVSSGEAVYAIPAEFLGLSFQESVAVAVIIALSILHILKINIGKRLQNTLTVISIGTIVLLIAVGFSGSGNSSIEFHSVFQINVSHTWLLALIPVMFTYSGWNAAVYVAEEIRNPEKNMLRAMIVGTSVVVLLYLLINMVYLKAASLDLLSGEIDVANLLTGQLLGTNGQLLVGLVILAALVSSISAMIMAGPRVYFAMARDGLFPASLKQVDPRFNTPSGSIMAQAGWSVLLILTGTFEELLTYTGFAIVLFSTLSVLALLAMKKNPFSQAPVKSILYSIFILVGIAMTVNAVIRSPLPSLAGVAMIGAGIPVFSWFRRKKTEGRKPKVTG